MARGGENAPGDARAGVAVSGPRGTRWTVSELSHARPAGSPTGLPRGSVSTLASACVGGLRGAACTLCSPKEGDCGWRGALASSL